MKHSFLNSFLDFSIFPNSLKRRKSEISEY